MLRCWNAKLNQLSGASPGGTLDKRSHHFTSRYHTAQLTRYKLQELGWALVLQAAFCPVLAPSNFFVFEPLKDALHGKRFANTVEVKEAVQRWFGKLI